MRSRYEDVVKRAFQYLNLSDFELGSGAAREVLQIIDAELGQGEDALLSRVLDRLEQRFSPNLENIERSAPPVCRASIGHT